MASARVVLAALLIGFASQCYALIANRGVVVNPPAVLGAGMPRSSQKQPLFQRRRMISDAGLPRPDCRRGAETGRSHLHTRPMVVNRQTLRGSSRRLERRHSCPLRDISDTSETTRPTLLEQINKLQERLMLQTSQLSLNQQRCASAAFVSAIPLLVLLSATSAAAEAAGPIVGACAEPYGLLPCSTSIGGNLFLMGAFGFFLVQAS